jgi:hypothetical protein
VAAHSFVRIGGQFFFAYRESYSPEFAAMFRDDELVTELNAPVYSLTVQQLRERLDLLGFTTATAQRRLETHFAAALEYEPDLEPFADWLDRNRAALHDDELAADEVPMWTNADPRLPLRLMLDAAPADAQASLDLSDVVSRGYVQGAADLCARAFAEQHTEAAYAPLIVLTEGRTDAEFLGLAVDVLAPHLTGFVRFLDYEFRPEGGTSALVRAVRAFAAAGVSNRVLALFDNDSAAADALTNLDMLGLPAHFRVRQLPHLALADSYPTLGPSGESRMDVNGRAVSVELFFGSDLLRLGGTKLSPVQWTGYVARLRRYQGEVMNKAALQDAFRLRAGRALRDGPRDDEDWSGMQALVDTIRTAFS